MRLHSVRQPRSRPCKFVARGVWKYCPRDPGARLFLFACAMLARKQLRFRWLRTTTHSFALAKSPTQRRGAPRGGQNPGWLLLRLTAGQAPRAADAYRELLGKTPATLPDPSVDLRHAAKLSRIYEILAGLDRRNGQANWARTLRPGAVLPVSRVRFASTLGIGSQLECRFRIILREGANLSQSAGSRLKKPYGNS